MCRFPGAISPICQPVFFKGEEYRIAVYLYMSRRARHTRLSFGVFTMVSLANSERMINFVGQSPLPRGMDISSVGHDTLSYVNGRVSSAPLSASEWNNLG